ncbi:MULTISPECIES: 2-phosphosulfolactate phosphatase [Acidiphilium]|uniref:Probable 2-phosphosulfolactate phosphatase n=1 Tax=Acidiphilium rubrum TaxID=526 RepID=A0A8G2CN27_ACIRU|nr:MULTISPECIES: 2-phosphosulfolactate phosphatase [Acidiphilium]SIR36053.1 2-phosphosulfolactate phosphatase [Acidiphilium rubrum]
MDKPRVFTEWGHHGLLALKPDVAVLIIIDVLSFCTAVDIAVARGATIIPFPHGDATSAAEAASQAGALCAARRSQSGGYSLSPHSLQTIEPGTKLLLPPPNGATITLAAGTTPILAGCLRNATATARAAQTIANGGAIGIIPAGERWADHTIRPAIEDWLGAGAIIDALDLPLDAESETARATLRTLRPGTHHPRLPGRHHPRDRARLQQHRLHHERGGWVSAVFVKQPSEEPSIKRTSFL